MRSLQVDGQREPTAGSSVAQSEPHPLRTMRARDGAPTVGPMRASPRRGRTRPGMASPAGWPLRSVLAGTAGTAAMTAAYGAERHVRHAAEPLDYDDGLVPGQIVAGIMHLPHVTGRQEHELGLALRWSYGSVFGLWHGVLRRKVGEPRASLAFFATLMTATFSLFPLLGRTPRPWRWPRDVLATAIGTHAVYVAAV